VIETPFSHAPKKPDEGSQGVYENQVSLAASSILKTRSQNSIETQE